MRTRFRPVLVGLVTLLSAPAFGQTLSLSTPPSGNNQKARVIQDIGPVKVSIAYSSPRVTLRGDDRRGKIWGQLVPYGLTELDFNDCKQCPWRAGANENTTFTASHDVKVQGQALKAGTYGLHMIPGKDEWTVIFSKNANSWGSYWYDPKEDALRVTTKPAKSEYHEWLTYEFTEREPAKATVALKWEELAVPFTISVENAPQLWVAKMREELRGSVGFDWRNFRQAAEYSLQNKVDNAEALVWAERALTPAVGGEENFQTLATLSKAQAANGKTADAQKTLDKAVSHPKAEPVQLHQVGRQLLAEGKKDEAMKIFQLNAKRFPDKWPVHVGLMRAYAAAGDKKKALDEGKLALAQAPNEPSKKNLESVMKQIEEGKKVD